MAEEPIKSHPDLARWEKSSKNTFWDYLGCEIEDLQMSKVVVSLMIQPHHLNLIGILHGGVHATMIDSAMGLVAMLVRPDASIVTVNLNMNYLAPMTEGRIKVEAEIVHASRKLMTAQAFARKDNGELCAFGTGTFRVIDSLPTSGGDKAI
ncbi:PaaI family thioesterase [Gorillibacterium massiliense]|uniref:PaaI family thioesterase n=1 Tax=Gorillibacterium massiliense TaxID=1280390 RepID=UPI0004B176C2|nr:PaaI family thioesterase [Gorillibacterium massiliense]